MSKLPIPEVTDVDMAFPAHPPLPAWDDIPEEFKHLNGTPFNRIVSKLFFQGGRLSDFGLTPKEGVDQIKTMRAIKACLGSFEPKQEHKEAGVAFMFSEWFDLTPPPGELS
jgi:hypothetical protein